MPSYEGVWNPVTPGLANSIHKVLAGSVKKMIIKSRDTINKWQALPIRLPLVRYTTYSVCPYSMNMGSKRSHPQIDSNDISASKEKRIKVSTNC